MELHQSHSAAVLYLHGKGGNAAEADHYRPLFPFCDVIGLDYRSDTPRKAAEEIRQAMDGLKRRYGEITLVANSIGAFFALYSGVGDLIRRAFLISPVVDLEALILGMMAREGVREEDLRVRGTVPTASGDVLSWEVLCDLRSHPIRWDVPTHILYGGRDLLVPYEAVRAFSEAHHARLTVMEEGEHWFHTEEQMKFLDAWIRAGWTAE